MRLGPKILTALSLLVAALGCWLAATATANVIENRSTDAVHGALIAAGQDWAEVHADGLLVHVGGIAPNEAARFNAMHLAGTVVDASRVVDGATVAPSAPLEAPPFSIEILRNDEGVTLIGLVPPSLDHAQLVNEITALAQGAEVVDLLETGSYAEPKGWQDAVHFGLNVLARLNRSKVSITPGRVSVEAISSSEAERQQFEKALTRRVPAGIEFHYDISAPRPVITPFTLRFLIDDKGARFDACSVDETRDRDRVLAAAREAGLEGDADCTIGLGVPTPEWANAAIQGIRAVADLGGGSITFSDTDVTLVATETTPQARFDAVVGELESNLPDVFALHSVLPEPVKTDDSGEGDGPPEFVATLSPEGQVQLRGRLNNAMVRDTVESYAKARFGVDKVHMAARTDEALPKEWTVRVLTALQALDELASGSAMVQQDYLEVRGTTGDPDGQAEVARILAEKLGESPNFRIYVSYDKKLDPVAGLPSPEECVGEVNELLAQGQITFEPGSAELSGQGIRVVNEIADILKACRKVEMQIEIAGHTDSQGREEMNLELSQSRADAVMAALMARRVLVSKLTAMGYGESEPIADNKTEEGREANRRIEFRLLGIDDGDGDSDGNAEATTDEAAGEEGAADAAAAEDPANPGAEAPEGSGDEGPAVDAAAPGSGDEDPAVAGGDQTTEGAQ